MAQEITLTYFDMAGRAEAARLCFHIGGVAFKDERLSFEEFGKAKAEGKFKYSQVPVLTVNGVQYAQSGAILRFAARKSGLYPTDELQALQTEQVLNSLPEFVDKIAATLSIQDQEVKKATRTELSKTVIPLWLERLNQLLVQNGTGYFVGNTLTVSDLSAYVAVGWIKSGMLDFIPTDLTNKFEALEKNWLLVHENEKVKQWTAAHQKK